MHHLFKANKSPRLSAEEKKAIAFESLNISNITEVAKNNHVSRNTVYTQIRKANQAINDAFDQSSSEDLLFYLPVTQLVIEQIILALSLICKSSYRDILQFMNDIFDYPMSIGNIFNIMDRSVKKAIEINDAYDLSSIKQSAADEIFHRNKPILAIVDIPSRFCAKLSKEDSRDAVTWEINLMDIKDKGFQPESAVTDQASGLTQAFKKQLENTELHYDHCHIIRACKTLVRQLKNRKESTITAAVTLLEKYERLNDKDKDTSDISDKITRANNIAYTAHNLYEQVNTLCTWLQFDVLQHTSFNPDDRGHLYEFIVEELSLVQDQQPQIDALVRSLVFQKDRLLSVSHTLNSHFKIIADEEGVCINDVWKICYFTRYEIQADNYHFHVEKHVDKLGERTYDRIEDRVMEAMAKTPRCSSMVENFNSRLRPFLDARKNITTRKLALYQFILNHRPFQRSAHTNLVGKTPAEALVQKSHPHWLEMLGYQRFKKTA